ncbi:hypothetical protein SLS64_008644 [Diaporthe eres]|uniref:G-protein coupled receptors family 2 profile 2 domain-containing protein n=1 Tax=Diaporthe eres TaxID=83184 RepID=A0ABR1PEK4_DIAER
MDVPLAEDREFAMLDEAQIETLNAVERMGATLSLFGITLIFITFALFRRLRTIPNTFIFFASVANIGACVACLIAYDGIRAMHRDRQAALCQAQGFLFEWFMQSDPWWSFAMAINVYMNLTSHAGPGFYGTVTTEVQVTSATIPTSPTPAYTSQFLEPSNPLHINTTTKGPIDTTHLRVDTSLGQERPPRLGTPAPNAPGGFSPIQTHHYPWSREPSSVSPTTGDIVSPSVTLVNSNDSSPFGFPKASARGQAHNFENVSFNGTQFTSTISAGSASKDEYDRDASPTRALPPLSANVSPCSGARRRLPPAAPAAKARRRLNVFQRTARGVRRFGAKLRNMDPVKLAYLRTSFVFAISVLVTWTPSSINRVYTLVYPDQASYGLNIAAAVVLPLQGVWNAVIYFTTSWKIFREEMEATRAGLRVLEVLRLDSGAGDRTTRQGSSAAGGGGGSFAIGSSVLTPRSEMGRSRRLDGESRDGNEIELVSTVGPPQRPRPAHRTSTMRVTKRGLDDFS